MEAQVVEQAGDRHFDLWYPLQLAHLSPARLTPRRVFSSPYPKWGMRDR